MVQGSELMQNQDVSVRTLASDLSLFCQVGFLCLLTSGFYDKSNRYIRRISRSSGLSVPRKSGLRHRSVAVNFVGETDRFLPSYHASPNAKTQ